MAPRYKDEPPLEPMLSPLLFFVGTLTSEKAQLFLSLVVSSKLSRMPVTLLLVTNGVMAAVMLRVRKDRLKFKLVGWANSTLGIPRAVTTAQPGPTKLSFVKVRLSAPSEPLFTLKDPVGQHRQAQTVVLFAPVGSTVVTSKVPEVRNPNADFSCSPDKPEVVVRAVDVVGAAGGVEPADTVGAAAGVVAGSDA